MVEEELESKKMERNGNWRKVGLFTSLLIFFALEITEYFYAREWFHHGIGLDVFRICMVVYCIVLFVAWQLRKIEFSFVQYIVAMIITLAFCLFIRDSAHNLAMYILQKDISYDFHYLSGSAGYINDILDEWNYERADASSKKTYDAMCKGVMITNWENPENQLQRLIADKLHISSFEQYRYHFYTVDGQAQVFLKVVDGRVTLRLVNPTPLITKKKGLECGYLEVTLE